MADLLSAATLLLTVLGVVYSAWYPEITAALAEPIPDNAPNRGPVRRRVKSALYRKALPLALAAGALTALFIPDTVKIAFKGMEEFRTAGCAAFEKYDAVAAAFSLVVILSAALAAYLFSLVFCLCAKLKTINAP
jgi:hypothetical protein